jgi:hypothetical protein
MYGKLCLLALLMVAETSSFGQSPTTMGANLSQAVTVVNSMARPVPVTITNAAVPVSGAVSITNNSVPVSGSVAVTNLPLDAAGNVLTTVVPDTTQYQYQTVIADPCNFVAGGPTDYCTSAGDSIASVLGTYSSQGYELFSVFPGSTVNSSGLTVFYSVYTLRASVAPKRHAGIQRK